MRIKELLTKDPYYSRIPADDLISRQRYKLFRTTSVVGAVACFIFVGQSLAFYAFSHPVVIGTLLIGCVFLANLFVLPWHNRDKLAYVIIGLASVMIIHLNMYDQGGIRASANYYMAPITLMVFMLLGNKLGRLMFVLVLLNFVYFYLISEFTNLTSFDIIGLSESQLNLDYLVTGVFAFFIIAAQLNYLESGKNVVIQRITQQRNELREKNKELNKLSIVASKADNAIQLCDESGSITWVNGGYTRLSGYSFAEVVGQNALEFMTGKDTSHSTLSQISEAIRKKEAFAAEILKYRKNGTAFWTQVTITPIHAEAGNEARFIFIESDITPRKLAEEKMKIYLENLERSNQELDKFAYVVSHDLKAPLRAIGNLTGWIEEDLGDKLPADAKAHFETIKGRVVRMEGLINGILDYTKASKDGGDLQSFSSADLVRDTVDLLGLNENVLVHIREENMPELKTERVKLQQVFLNLIHNAVKYCTKEQVLVDISCCESDDFWEFSVSDNGPGIDARYHEKIFVIFQTLNARDEVESRGVGLAIVKKIIEEQGGTIWVVSEPNNGACFRFTWPKGLKKDAEHLLLLKSDLSPETI